MAESVTINTSAENTGPSLEEEAAAQDAAASKATDTKLPSETQEGTEERPQWLPEKFKSPEDLAKAYSELEKRMGQPKGNEGAPEGLSEAEQAIDNAGLNYDAFAQEYAENGALSEDAYAALEAAGIPKNLVDNYIAGLEAQQTMLQSEVYQTVGGEEVYNEMISWAGENLDDASIDAFNATLEGGNPAQIKLAIAGLRAQYTEANGREPSRTLSGTASAGSGVYESTAEMMKDMADPRYKEDAAFRQRVQEKLGRSNIL